MFFGRCANELVRYLFETLPVITHFNLGSMGFLNEVNFQKLSKIVEKKRKLGNFGSFINFEKLYPTRFHDLRYSILQKFLWLQQSL